MHRTKQTAAGVSIVILVVMAFSAMLTSRAEAFTRVLSVGSNHSYDPRLATLKFAESDAKKFALAMKTVGMVPDLKIMTMLDPSVAEFRSVLDQIEQEQGKVVAGRPEKAKLIFYFSGHADENGLHLKDGIIPKAELHSFLSKTDHDTKVAILDSCFSGALVAKGVRKSGAFDIPLLNVDEPTGSIYLTSSSSSQFAYESDSLRGSVFSHHLISGMYGEADMNKDGVVTVDELYQYVYKNTKWHALTLPQKRTQDPEMSAKLHGQGAIVLSYPVELDSVIHLDQDLSGVVSITAESGYQIFSVQKVRGDARDIKMPPGRYNFSIVDGAKAEQGSFKLTSQKTTSLHPSDLTWVDESEIQREKGIAKADVTSEKEVTQVDEPKKKSSIIQADPIRRFAVGVHGGFSESEFGPYAGFSFGRLFYHRALTWIALGFEARVGGFQTEEGGDDRYESITYSGGSGQMLAKFRFGPMEFGYGFGEMGVLQKRSDSQGDDKYKRVGMPMTTGTVGLNFTTKGGHTVGLEYARERLEMATAADHLTAKNTYTLQFHYGI